MINKSDVIKIYQLLLDREPESEGVIESHLKTHENQQSLRRSILASAEYRMKNPVDFSASYYRDIQPQVDIHASREEMTQLFSSVSEGWTRLGAEEPHWSVLTDQKYKQASISENLDTFYRTGFGHKQLLDAFCSRNSIEYKNDLCLELGCGVGRITAALAASFKNVVALDVSPNNLRLCEQRLKEEKIDNVELRLIKNIQEFDSLPKYDVFFSLITLQHNPPPVQLFILDKILSNGSTGSVSFFQTPHHWPDYSFSSAAYLSAAQNQRERSLSDYMEMHPPPMRFIFELLMKTRHKLLEATPDHWTGNGGSFTYLSQKE